MRLKAKPGLGEVVSTQQELTEFELLYKRWSGILHQYAAYFVKDEEAAGSLVNDLFVQFWFNKIKPENLKGYLFRAIKNASINYLTQQRGSLLTLLDQEELTMISDLLPVTDAAEESERLIFLQSLIDKLPQKRQLVFKMHRIEGFSYAEIAGLLQISIRTVEDHLSKSMQFIHVNSKHMLHKNLTEA